MYAPAFLSKKKKIIILYLDMPVDQPIQLEVIVIFPEGVDQGFSHLEPTKEEGELDGEKERVEKVQLRSGAAKR